MIKPLLCLAVVFLTFASRAFAIDEQRVKDAARRMAGAGLGWDCQQRVRLQAQRPDDVIGARVVFHWSGPKYRDTIGRFRTFLSVGGQNPANPRLHPRSLPEIIQIDVSSTLFQQSGSLRENTRNGK